MERSAQDCSEYLCPSFLPPLQLFGLIGLKTTGPLAVSKETVTLAHFLDVADALVKNVDAIKSLDAQALVRERDRVDVHHPQGGGSRMSRSLIPP